MIFRTAPYQVEDPCLDRRQRDVGRKDGLTAVLHARLMIALFIWLFHGPGYGSRGLLTPRTGRALARSSTASAKSLPSTYRSACSSSSSAPVPLLTRAA